MTEEGAPAADLTGGAVSAEAVPDGAADGAPSDVAVSAPVPTDGAEPVRFRIDLGYAGTGFHGWAVQPSLRTVQGVVEAGLEKVCGQPVRTVVAGRTDAGVHARRQVVHCDLPPGAVERLSGRGTRTWEPADGLVSRLRGVLGHLGAPDVVIHSAQRVPAAFDARFSAVWRRYSYRIADAHAFRDPLAADHTTTHRGALDDRAMARAAQEVLGLHDFLPFCKPRPESTTIRTLLDFDVARDASGVIVLDLRADAFCHHMVRALVGGLVRVGTGAWSPTEPARLLARAEAGEDRDALPPFHLMPAQGLVLEEVGYPDGPEAWARQAENARNRRRAEELGT